MFEDVSDRIAHNPPGLHGGVAVADFGGVSVFVVAGCGGPNRVLAWAGGALRDVAPPELADADRRAVGVAAADLDGDGREELYILNADTRSKRFADRLFKRAPDGRWHDLFECPANRAARTAAGGRGVAVIDRRGVGRYGFVVANPGRPLRLVELSPGGALTDLAAPLGLAHATGGGGLLALPLFGSPHPDIFCANESGRNFAYRNRGDGTFTEVACELGLTDCEERTRGATAFDANGELALAWANIDGPHRLMMPTANGSWKDAATPAFAFPSAARTPVAADFDNDGRDELFLNHMGEPNRLFRVLANPGRKAGGGITVAMLSAGAAADPDGFGTGAAVADIDGDGILELLVARGERGAQPLALYKARAAYPHWLRVRPLTRFGAPARGAVVRAEYGGRVRAKGIGGGPLEPVAHFGLGESRAIACVTVTWPDGAAVALLNPGGNRVLAVPYPRG